MSELLSLFIGSIISLSALHAQDQMFDICPLKVGETVPDSIHITNIDGEKILFKDLIKEDKVILVFYRGAWCPYCTRHLSALGQIKEEIDSLGYSLYGITPDQFDSLAVSQITFQNEYQIFPYSKADLITAFGLGWKIEA